MAASNASPPAARAWTARTLDEVAAVCGVSRDTVRDWRRDGMPGSAGKYPLAEVIRWLRTAGPWRPRGSRPAEDDDPDTADSPALERLREARAAIAELDLEERRNQLIDRGAMRGLLARFAALMRTLGDRLGARFGADAQQLLLDTLDEADRMFADELHEEPEDPDAP